MSQGGPKTRNGAMDGVCVGLAGKVEFPYFARDVADSDPREGTMPDEPD
jgi:hypothetical protein